MKELEYYMTLEYRVNLCPLSDDDGGGWLAEIPELKGCVSDGDTPEEALHNIQDAKLSWIKTALKRGQKIPVPIIEEQDDFSGKFTLRLPRFLHKELTNAARKENISLNQYIVALLSFNFGKRMAENNGKPIVQNVYIYNHENIQPNLKRKYPPVGDLTENSLGLWLQPDNEWGDN